AAAARRGYLRGGPGGVAPPPRAAAGAGRRAAAAVQPHGRAGRPCCAAGPALHCAARGQAGAEVSAVRLGMAGQEPLEPAASRLLMVPQGVDLAWGLVAGCRAALLLSVS